LGAFITFEGIEGCGKTTQIKKAADFLRRNNIDVFLTEEPGGSALGVELRRILLNRNESSAGISARSEILLFLADRAQHVDEIIRPALERVAARYGDAVRKAEWEEGYCPICGRDPKIGEIRDEDGSRYLFCNQCGFEWNYLRIKCPFCGNEEQQSLAYFTIEGDERYRVDVCNECKRYIKIVDFREAKQKADLDVEDIATIHLDMLANEEGYD